ncbi:unnamed protein product [Oncorhynchus mykiss]|uniref:Mitochondrial fission regulator n=1 Tax=Oncorhynchus mykiss TaxID=8022 RepID=A0A060XJ45_ONCMY|nr:unnamed protein product [Oncorhynchus mykiss]
MLLDISQLSTLCKTCYINGVKRMTKTVGEQKAVIGRCRKDMSKAYGSSRSIVRRTATNLPLKPCPRVHFQLNLYTEDCSVLNSAGRRNGLVASLADVVWIDREDENDWFGFGRLRSEAPSLLMFRSHPPQPKQQPLPRRRSLPSLHQGQTRSNDEAIQKISALEMELAKLGAQIAQVVLLPQVPLHLLHSWDSSGASRSLTSSRSTVGIRQMARHCWTRSPSRQRSPTCWIHRQSQATPR